MERDRFTFHQVYYEKAKRLSKRDFVPFMEAIFKYSLNGFFDASLLSKKAWKAFEEIRPILDKEIRLSKEGRRSKEYKSWRNSVFERDNYTCQLCGARGVKLNAHHKNGYAFYPELRYELSNGITLCVPCHKKVHGR